MDVACFGAINNNVSDPSVALTAPQGYYLLRAIDMTITS